MTQPYYYHEHLAGYAEMQARGLKTWGEVHGDADDFLQFSSREFLEYILPKLDRASAARLAPGGCYVSSCCVYEAERIRVDEEIVDRATGKRYLRFDESGLWDDTAEICYSLFRADRHRPAIEARDYEGAIEVNGQWYIMQRCYRRPEHLREELASYGLEMVHQSGAVMENSVCVHAGTGSAVAFA